MSKEKSIIIIDGGNFYHKLKSLSFNQLLSFNFQAFCSSIARSTDLISCTYYVGEVKTTGTKKSQKMYDAQQRLLGHLKKSRLRYTFGYLLKDGDGVYHEKGVDVHMAVDILVATYENLCDRIILVSSDTDLIPAIKKAQAKGKIVEYIGFSHQKSIALLTSCKEARLLTKEDIQPFISN